MKTISELKNQINALIKASKDIDAQCVAENRGLTDAEKTLKNDILDEIESLEEEVKVRERDEAITARIESAPKPETDPKPVIQNSEIKPKGLGIEVRDKDKFRSFGEQMSAIIRAGSPGGQIDPRLRNAATGMSEMVSSDGGFLVQQDFANRLAENLFNNGVIASRCSRIPISGNANGTVINGFDETSRASSTHGGIIIYYADEAEEKTASKPKFRKVELSLKKLIGLYYMTDELMMDATGLEAAVSNAFRQAFDFKLQDGIINGTGAGMPLGIMNSGSLVSVSAETGQASSTIVTENIVNMYARRFASQTSNYAWFYNQDIEPQLFTMSLAVGTGGSAVYMPPGGLSQSPYGTLMGLPAIAIEQCATLGTTGDLILANFSDGYLLAEKGGMQSDVSIHVRFVYDETALRFVLRVDGQPWRASKLTPYKGSNEQSHFIVLETR